DHTTAGWWYTSEGNERTIDCVDGLDMSEKFENVWAELKGGFGTQHETDNKNNCEDLD
ncbi:3603_t:CDS:2, partial [Entrophospora sp. SA101]